MSFKLDPEEKERWLKDLRSGEFKQCTGKLRKGTESGYSYCCLGVKVHDKFEDSGLLDSKIDPYVVLPTGVFSDLYTKNDTDKWSFIQIADYIEEVY